MINEIKTSETGIHDTWPQGVPFLRRETLSELKKTEWGKSIFEKRGASSEIRMAAADFLRSGLYAKLDTADQKSERVMVPRANVTIVKGGEIYKDIPGYMVSQYCNLGEAFLTPSTYGMYPGLRPPREVVLAAAISDDRWKLIFRTIQSTEYNGERYDRADMAIQFERLELGEAPKFGKVTGTYTTLPNLKWGAGMLLHKEWIEGNKVWQINDMMNGARIKSNQTISKFFYALLKAASFNSTAYATSWIDTLNDAYYRLCRAYVGDNENDKVYNPGDPLVVVCPVEKLASILQAIRMAQVPSYQGTELVFPVSVVIDTTEYLSSDKFLDIIVPQKEFIHQEYKPLYVESDYDIALDGQRWFWRFLMNGLIRTVKAGERITWA